MLLFHGLLCLLAYCVLALGLGRRLSVWLRLRLSPGLESGIVCFGLGAGAMQAVPIALFALGTGSSTAFRIVFAVLAFAVIPDLVRAVRECAAKSDHGRRLEAYQIAFFAILSLLLLAIFLRAVCPPTDGDTLSYHLTAARRFLQAERFVFLPAVTHTNWPLGVESLYASLLAVDRGAPIAVIQFALGLVALGGIWLLARRLGSRAAACGALVILMLDAGFWQEMGMAYVDMGVTAFATLAVYGLLRVGSREDAGAWRIAAAVFAGLAATCKLNGVWVIVALSIVLLATGDQPWRSRARSALGFSVVASAVVAPWFIRTWVLTGNPFYPAFYGAFGGKEWTATGFARLHEFYLRLNVPPGYPPSPKVLQGAHAAVAVAGLLLATVIFRMTRRSELAIPARFAVSFTALVCTFSIVNLRFLLAALPCVAVCAAVPFRKLSPRAGWTFAILGAFLAFRLGDKKVDPDFRTALAVAIGSTPASEYQRAGVLDYDVVQFANRNLPPNARIAVSELAVDAALYDRPAAWTDYWMQDSFHFDSPERLEEDMRRMGITHVVIQTEYPNWCPRSYVCERRTNVERTMLLAFAQRRGALLLKTDKVALYRVTP